MGIRFNPQIMVGFFLDPLRLVLTIYSILDQFLDFHQFAIFLQNDVIMQQWFQLHDTSWNIPCHTIIYSISSPMPCHVVISHIIIHAMSSLPLSFTEFVLTSYPWLFLCHYWTPLTSMFIHVMNPLSFTYFILLPCLFVIPLSFVNSFDINDNYILNNLPLWHWWQHLNKIF